MKPDMTEWDPALYKGLQSLMSLAFPRRCGRCGMEYRTADEFLARTESVRELSGLRESRYEDGKAVVELFRNCICGSTLMEVFRDRRDASSQGRRRRHAFDKILKALVEKGIRRETARRELLEIMRGGESGLLRREGLSIPDRSKECVTRSGEPGILSDEEP